MVRDRKLPSQVSHRKVIPGICFFPDKEDVVDPPKDDTLDSNLEKEMEMELDKMESGNVDDIDDAILDDSLENNDTKACDKEKEEANREVTGHMEDVCNKTESEEIKNDKPTESTDITAREECKAEESNFDQSDKSIDSKSDTEVACSEKDSVKDEAPDQTEKRKRAASSDSSASGVKKSRLDSVIGRLGSHIGVRPDDSPSDETDASPVEHCKPMAETKSEIISKESESSNEPATKDNKKTIKLTKKVELNNFTYLPNMNCIAQASLVSPSMIWNVSYISIPVLSLTVQSP